MALLKILEYPDPRLRTRAQPVAAVDDKIRRLVADMLETMYAAPGVGLAATQVDVHLRVIVMDISEEKNQPLALINPEILEKEDIETGEEGCLSVPGVTETVERARRIKVRALDLQGKPIEFDGRGPAGRVHPARDRSSRGQALRGLPVRAQAPAHQEEARPSPPAARRRSHRRTSARHLSHATGAHHLRRLAGIRGAGARAPRRFRPSRSSPCSPSPTARRAGAGTLTASPVKQCALSHGLERAAAGEPEARCAGARARSRGCAPDLIVVVAYGLILPRAVLDIPRRGCINIHASLLPRWRGAAPIQAAVLAGDAQTGVAIMRLEEGLDTGPVAAMRAGADRRRRRPPASCTTVSRSSAPTSSCRPSTPFSTVPPSSRRSRRGRELCAEAVEGRRA